MLAQESIFEIARRFDSDTLPSLRHGWASIINTINPTFRWEG